MLLFSVLGAALWQSVGLAELTWYHTDGTLSWQGSKEFCGERNKRLCSRNELCPSNQVQGGTRSDDVWNPVSDANNMWIFAGNVRWPACAGHHEINGGVYGNPGWGPTTTSLYFRKQLACCADASSDCAHLDGGGWTRVRHAPAGASKWHKAADHLAGTAQYGSHTNDAEEWSVRFDTASFNEFLFASGDCSLWLVASKMSVYGSYANAERVITRSSTSSGSYHARWYNRVNAEDPWISLDDHAAAIQRGTLLYGGNGFAWGSHTLVLRRNGGADVYIRNKGAGRRLELAARRLEPSTIAGDAQSVLDDEEEGTPSDRS